MHWHQSNCSLLPLSNIGLPFTRHHVHTLFRCLHNTAPSYLADSLRRAADVDGRWRYRYRYYWFTAKWPLFS